MKRLLAAVVALGVVSGVGLCAGASDSALEGKILGLEAKRIEAMVKKDIAGFIGLVISGGAGLATLVPGL